MTKQKSRVLGPVIVTLLIIVAAGGRFLSIEGIPPMLPGLLRSIIYISLMAAWWLSVQARVIQTQARRYLTAAVALSVLWMLLRTVKFLFIPVQSMARPVWYLYYLPMLFIPLMAVLLAASLGRPENAPTPAPALALTVPTALLLLLVLTNDLHQLVFSFPPGKPWTDHDYGYGPGFFLVMGWEMVLSVTAFAVMVKRCRVRTLKTAVPLVIMGLSIAYAVLYNAGCRWLYVIAGDVTVVQCCLFALCFESCIRCGLIRSNTGYDDLFEACTLGVRITDGDYQTRYASLLAPELPPEVMREAGKAPVRVDKDTLVKSSEIPGGHVLWKEDITELTAVIEDLEAAGRELEERSLVEQENYRAQHRISSLREKNRLLDLVQQQTETQIAVLDRLRRRYDGERDEKARCRLLAMTAVVGTYIKRCGNLLLLGESGEDTDLEELTRCLEESFSNLELLGVSCGCDLPPKTTIRAWDAIRAYRVFETVIEAALEDLDSVWLKGRQDRQHILLRVGVACKTDLSGLAGIADGYAGENGEYSFTVRMKKGGGKK